MVLSYEARRYFLIVKDINDISVDCIDAKGRLMTFDIKKIDYLKEMSINQKKKFDFIRLGGCYYG